MGLIQSTRARELGSTARAGSHLLVVDVTVKSLRSSYMGLYPQKIEAETRDRGEVARGKLREGLRDNS